MPTPFSIFPSCRLGHLPSHPPRSLHGLHPAVQRAPLRGTCLAPGPSSSISVAESPGEVGTPPTWASLHFSACLSSRVSASLQDRMVLLVMGNIINWSL